MTEVYIYQGEVPLFFATGRKNWHMPSWNWYDSLA
jgi:hypothetical protein